MSSVAVFVHCCLYPYVLLPLYIRAYTVTRMHNPKRLCQSAGSNARTRFVYRHLWYTMACVKLGRLRQQCNMQLLGCRALTGQLFLTACGALPSCGITLEPPCSRGQLPTCSVFTTNARLRSACCSKLLLVELAHIHTTMSAHLRQSLPQHLSPHTVAHVNCLSHLAAHVTK